MREFAPLYQRRILPETLDTRQKNGINGYDAERMAAALAILASGGEIQWSSRTEEGHKIDLMLSFENPVYPGNRIVVQVQVKSGKSYGEVLDNGFKLDSRAKREVRREAKPVIVFWTDRKSDTFYWAYIHPKTQAGSQFYGDNHKVSPSLKYDIARCEGNWYLSSRGGVGVFISMSNASFPDQRTDAKRYYKLFKEQCFSPVLGKIECTRVGWRHMFRSMRSLEERKSSCRCIKHIKALLAQPPSTIFALNPIIHPDIHPDYDIRRTEYVLQYKECKMHDPISGNPEFVTVILRLIEEIRYPSNWRTNGIISQRTDRTVSLLSCYMQTKAEKQLQKSKRPAKKKKRKK